jgi:hypothetical protein
MSQLHETSREVRNTQVAVRFALRIVVLCVFARLGSVGFAASLNTLLWMSAIMSIAIAAFRREAMFEPFLTYWDEAAIYGSLCCAIYAFIQATAL